jgi:hypothetical protein
MGWGDMTSSQLYGKRLFRQRRMLNHYLFHGRTEEYYPMQLKYSRQTLVRLLQDPSSYKKAFLRYIRLASINTELTNPSRFSASLIVQVAYGHEIKTDDDEYFRLAQEAIDAVNNAGPLGNTIVDFFPFCMYPARLWLAASEFMGSWGVFSNAHAQVVSGNILRRVLPSHAIRCAGLHEPSLRVCSKTVGASRWPHWISNALTL